MALSAVQPTEMSADAFETALALLATPVLLVEADTTVAFANRQARLLLGCGEAPRMPLETLLASRGVSGILPLPSDAVAKTGARLLLHDGRAVNAECRFLPGGGAAVTLDDVSAFLREAERARVDPLTGLTNRIGLHTVLDSLLASGMPVALFCIDLDRFKGVNDTLGHPVGDALLRKVAERLMTVVAEGDVVARLGGDEFVVVKAGNVSREDAERVATRIVDLIGRSYVLQGHMLNIGASVGIALAPGDAAEGEILLKHADLALYGAKAAGRGRFRFFEPRMDALMQARRSLELDLRRALALKEFHVVYQPQVSLQTHEVVGFEALLRWHNAARGIVSPAEFIPLAEETGLIVSIGEWVLRTACREAASWTRPVTVAVNLSPVQFRGPNLVQTVVSALARAGLPPDRLDLEITEGALMVETEQVVATLRNLRGLGVRISMDDFGTGYSSLSYLQKFPFDTIKIDQSFVRGMAENVEAEAIVRAVARLGASLGMKTTAEGVETEAQLAAIRAQGCSHVQGYLTGRPLAGSDAAALVASGGGWRAVQEGEDA